MKKKILSVKDPSFETCRKRVVIRNDENPPDPLHDWDQTFLLHSRMPYEFIGNERDKGYRKPLEEILDKDGNGTGEYRLKDDAVSFSVAAYIHSGIALKLGNGSEFPDQRWDVTRGAATIWTDKERFEKMNCKDGWMKVPGKNGKLRKARSKAEFREFLRKIAENELKDLMKCWSGQVYGYVTEEAVKYKKTYEDGTETEGVEWRDAGDSCWGYVVDKAVDIEFPKGADWTVFDETGAFVGEEYEADPA